LKRQIFFRITFNMLFKAAVVVSFIIKLLPLNIRNINVMNVDTRIVQVLRRFSDTDAIEPRRKNEL
jgi:hypothetical protein